RERNGEKVTTKVTAKVMGDTLKGKLESDWGGENRTADWEAKRVKETSDASVVTGSWKYDVALDNGSVLNLVLELKQQGEKVTGKVMAGDFETSITEGKVAGDSVSFKIPVETGGASFISKYNGTISGDNIKGKIHSDISGQDREYD